MTAHLYPARVYYGDTDAGGVVYHAAYLRLAEQARTEALREAGLPHSEMQAKHGCIFMVRRITIEYLRPAKLDDLLTIATTTRAETVATITLRQDFAREGEKIAELDVFLVCVSTARAKPARIPPPWRHAFGPQTG